MVFIVLGIMLIGFGLLSLSNILNMGITQHQRDHADLTTPEFWVQMSKFIVIGLILIGIGVIFAVLA